MNSKLRIPLCWKGLDDVAAESLVGWKLPLDAIIADALCDQPKPASPLASTPITTAPVSTARTGTGATANLAPAGLSAREIEVLRLIVDGRTNAEIAELLVVSANTVRHHVTHILDKTGCENRAAATAFALRHNLV